MAKKKSYDEASVIRSLSKKSSIRVNTNTKVIEVVRDSTDVGNGSWGKIDYLTKVHGYVYVFVKNMPRKYVNTNESSNNEETINTKMAKREAKLNMAAMTKSAMKRVKSK